MSLALALAACARPAPAQTDLPPAAETLDLTRQAMAQLRERDGFLPAIAQVQECYGALTPASPLRQRVYCLQLDALAYEIESRAPLDWQRADARANAYLTPGAFFQRQNQNMPLFSGDDGEQRKQAVVEALAAATAQVLTEEDQRRSAQAR